MLGSIIIVLFDHFLPACLYAKKLRIEIYAGYGIQQDEKSLGNKCILTIFHSAFSVFDEK